MLIELDVFATGLSAAVYLYASAAFLLALTTAALWLTRRPSSAPLTLSHRAAN